MDDPPSRGQVEVRLIGEPGLIEVVVAALADRFPCRQDWPARSVGDDLAVQYAVVTADDRS